MTLIKRILRSFYNGMHGVGDAFSTDLSFRLEVTIGVPALALFMYLLWPLSVTQILFLLSGVALIYVTELVNTAVETLLDRLHPVRNRMIRSSKDIASGAVLLAFIYTCAVAVLILLTKLEILAM